MTRASIRIARAAAAACLVLVAAAAPGYGSAIGGFGGHLAVGYGQLMITDGPGGSISFTGGVDYPVASALRVGIDVGYDLLGTRTVERGSLGANVDYSAFEAVAFAHWTPEHLGPIGRVSVGPMLMAAHGDISAAAGGAGFSDLSVGETAPGGAAELTFISRAPSPVRVGLQLGARVAGLKHENWTVLSARVTFHY